MVLMKEQIDKIVQDGNWEFARLLKLSDICEELSHNFWLSLDSGSINELIWDSVVKEDGTTLGMLIKENAIRKLKQEFMTSFQKSFETATVQFKPPAKETITDESITQEQPPLPKKKMIKGEDGLDMPKGVKRI